MAANEPKTPHRKPADAIEPVFKPETAFDAVAKEEDQHSSRVALRSIALFEAGKGGLVLFVGLGLASFFHHGAQHMLESIARHFSLNPAHHTPEIFIEALNRAANVNLWLLALGALAYSLVRFIEAYGLWHQLVWAEWFAIASGAIYLPLEIYEIIRKYSHIKLGITIFNILIVAYLAWQRFAQERVLAKRKPPPKDV